MKIVHFIITVLLFGATTSFTPRDPLNSQKQQIEAKEREEIDALKTGDKAAFSNLIAGDAVFVDSRGTANNDEVVSHVTDFRVLEYSIEDLQFVSVSQDTGVIAYKLKLKATGQRGEFTATQYASAVWTKRQGQWVCLFSQETPAK